MYPTNKEFLKKCGVSNHSLITDLKKGRIKNPGGDILALIVRGTGCNGTWLLTGEEEMFDVENKVSQTNGNAPAKFLGAVNLIKKIERNADGELNEVPEELEIQLARLLVKILEHRWDLK